MKSETQFFRKKKRISRIFGTFVRYKINLGIGSIMRPIHIYIYIYIYIISKVYTAYSY
jgi:hypothetical protein